jgi:hypothetical protein
MFVYTFLRKTLSSTFIRVGVGRISNQPRLYFFPILILVYGHKVKRRVKGYSKLGKLKPTFLFPSFFIIIIFPDKVYIISRISLEGGLLINSDYTIKKTSAILRCCEG